MVGPPSSTPSASLMKLIVNVSGAYPGTKEWVQYGVTPYQDKLKMVAGNTGVQ